MCSALSKILIRAIVDFSLISVSLDSIDRLPDRFFYLHELLCMRDPLNFASIKIIRMFYSMLL